MCEYYSNAAITITASKADGSSDGFSGDQEDARFATIPYAGTTVFVRDNIARDHGYDVLAVEGTNIGPVNNRAWTYYEAVLSH